jgi:GTP-binding protein Era
MEPIPIGVSRAAMIAVVGRTNVGKSTLVNRIVGEKIAIVTPVPQTTRIPLRGILTEPRGQLVLIDTPGLHRPFTLLGKTMNRAARASAQGADAVLLVLDESTPPRPEDQGWMQRLSRAPVPTVLALNKIDRGRSNEAAYRAFWSTVTPEQAPAPAGSWHRVSALHGQGVSELVDALFNLAPAGPPLFPEDLLTDYPRRLAIADVVREKLMPHLRQELPHQVAVWVDSLEEDAAAWRVGVVVYVERESQKPIVLGEGGCVLRSVRSESASELSSVFGLRVELDIRVKIQPGWAESMPTLKRLGYV